MNQEARRNNNQNKNNAQKSSNAVREAALKASITAIDGNPSQPQNRSENRTEKREKNNTSTKAAIDGAAFTTSAIWGNFDHIQQAQDSAFAQGRDALESFFNSATSALSGNADWAEINRIQSEAAIEAADIASEVVQTIGTEISELSNSILAEQFKAFERFLGCKTPADFFNLQSEFVKNSVDQGINRLSNIAQHCIDFSKAVEPINRSISQASEKIADAIAKEPK